MILPLPPQARIIKRVFAIPAVLAALIALGLTSGVLGDGIWDVISWGALAIPLLVIAWFVSIAAARYPKRTCSRPRE